MAGAVLLNTYRGTRASWASGAQFKGAGGSDGAASALKSVMAAPQRVPLIADQVQGIENRTHALHEAISRVTDRLSSVLAPEPPSGEASAKAPQHGIGMVDALQEINSRLEYALARLTSLTNRIEV